MSDFKPGDKIPAFGKTAFPAVLRLQECAFSYGTNPELVSGFLNRMGGNTRVSFKKFAQPANLRRRSNGS
jgi:hypothetical protein